MRRQEVQYDGAIFDIDGTIVSGAQERVPARLHYLFQLTTPKDSNITIDPMDPEWVPCKNIESEMLEHLDKYFNGKENEISSILPFAHNVLNAYFGEEIDITENKNTPIEQLAYYIDRAYTALCEREAELIKANKLDDLYHLPKKAVIEGSVEKTQELRNAGIPVVFASNNRTNGTLSTLKSLGLAEIITKETITCSNDPLVGKEREKPNPHHMEVSLQKAGIDPSKNIKIMVAGDGIGSDMRGALALAQKHPQMSVAAKFITQSHSTIDQEAINAFKAEADLTPNFSFEHILEYSLWKIPEIGLSNQQAAEEANPAQTNEQQYISSKSTGLNL